MNGGEKDEMLAVLDEIFIGTGLANIDIQKKLGFETFNDIDLYATFIIPPKNVKVEQVTFDSLKNDVKNLLSKNDEFGKVFRKSVTQIDDLNLYDGNVLNEKRLKGKIVIQEYKSSETAGFTENQLDIYHRNRDILITDGVVKNGDGSLKIIPKGTKVTVIRPGDVI